MWINAEKNLLETSKNLNIVQGKIFRKMWQSYKQTFICALTHELKHYESRGDTIKDVSAPLSLLLSH